MDKRIESIIVEKEKTIKGVMQCIDKSGIGIALVVNRGRKLLGVATDGDIRRALLSGKSFDSSISSVMNTKPTIALEETSASELLDLMLKKSIGQIPIIDTEGTIVDLVLLSQLKSIPLSSPDITHKEIEIINQVLATPSLSIGPKIKEFEQKIANYIGTRHAVAVNSGTSALHLGIRGLDIKDGDEVITTPFSFIASANCALFERAKPIFVDIDKNTLCIDVTKIEEKISTKTKAILPVHVFGHPCQMDKVMEIARLHHLVVIEDACEAIGAEYKGKKVGSFGNVGVFAFYPNKQITTAEGGMIVTDDENIAELCRSMRNQGREDNNSWLSHKRLGYNYRMSELSAALGVAQTNRIDEILKKRQQVADFYNERLKEADEVEIPYIDPDVKMSWFVYVIRLNSERFSREGRDRILQELKGKGISCSNYFPPIHLEPFYQQLFGYKEGDFPITEKVSGLTIAMPFYNNLTEEEVDYICNSLKDIIIKIG